MLNKVKYNTNTSKMGLTAPNALGNDQTLFVKHLQFANQAISERLAQGAWGGQAPPALS